ncbi:hypothetical protein RXV86_04170 [Alisedimentitalea sp. MJ-SS2]|uniref:hypothetical protein n=1 Tax=Aliisedimentitalea sp. MJ-SS2 TaxID=3049795 RepID=UPI00290E0437|nr:hypothetical protein [Alisedimentitalea sp. MJ-SS2]MDU8926575.1 hypothetical protein [Alisedimentitalea sp. MJ-SS2]
MSEKPPKTVKESLEEHAADTFKSAVAGATIGGRVSKSLAGAGVGALTGAASTAVLKTVEAGREAYALHEAEQEAEEAERRAAEMEERLKEHRANAERR